jgi:hypothetical protein
MMNAQGNSPMPGPAISKYLAQHTDKGFNEVATVFRHDFVQFMGMLHSWTVMIDGEISTADVSALTDVAAVARFRDTSAELQRAAERIFNETQARLRPEIDPANSLNGASPILQTWDRFYNDFGVYAMMELNTLEKLMRQFVTYSEFDTLIEKTLSPMAQGDSIKTLLLKPFDRIRDLLDANQFDARIAQVLGEKHP